VFSRPIAGTRPRGGSIAEDLTLEAELLADPKELAEHVMLIDLARNDLGRVCSFGTVTVDDLMVIERYSHVMHIVSGVSGDLREGIGPIDVLKATFPHGTVTGAPKVRAMEIIDDLEPTARGPYAGAVGYVDFSGNLDTAIGLRTCVVKGSTAWVQAGAGVVVDSDPTREFEECLAKARAVLTAIAAASTM
jgi:anthranilate synthase component 1